MDVVMCHVGCLCTLHRLVKAACKQYPETFTHDAVDFVMQQLMDT